MTKQEKRIAIIITSFDFENLILTTRSKLITELKFCKNHLPDIWESLQCFSDKDIEDKSTVELAELFFHKKNIVKIFQNISTL